MNIDNKKAWYTALKDLFMDKIAAPEGQFLNESTVSYK